MLPATPTHAYSFDVMNYFRPQIDVGCLKSISFPQIGKVAVADFEITRPPKEEVTKMVAIFDKLSWKGASDDPIELTGRISERNYCLFKGIASQLLKVDFARFELAVYSYCMNYRDKKEKDNFLLCTDQPIHLKIASLTVSENVNRDGVMPQNYSFVMKLSGILHKHQQYLYRFVEIGSDRAVNRYPIGTSENKDEDDKGFDFPIYVD